MSRIYDVSVPIRDGGLIYPGNPEIRIALQQAIDRGDSSNVSALAFGSHTGTHVDAPLHMFAHGTPIDAIPLDLLMGPAVVVDVGPDVLAIGRRELEGHVPKATIRVLFKTRNSGYLTQDPSFHPDYTYLAPDGAEYLVSIGVKLVGIDYLSIEQFHSGHHRTHHVLLSNAVVIVEGLNLAEVTSGPYEFRCLPLQLTGCDGAPARAVLIET